MKQEHFRGPGGQPGAGQIFWEDAHLFSRGSPGVHPFPAFSPAAPSASNVLPQLPNSSSGPGSKAASRNPQHSPLSPWPGPAPAELNVVCLGTPAPSSPSESQKRESRDYFQVNLGERGIVAEGRADGGIPGTGWAGSRGRFLVANSSVLGWSGRAEHLHWGKSRSERLEFSFLPRPALLSV